jgi:hypothetical protein
LYRGEPDRNGSQGLQKSKSFINIKSKDLVHQTLPRDEEPKYHTPVKQTRFSKIKEDIPLEILQIISPLKTTAPKMDNQSVN